MLGEAGEPFIPLTGVTRHSRPTPTGDMHTKAGDAVPRGLISCDDRGFCPRHFPLLADEQVTACHVIHRDTTAMFNLFEMVTKPCCNAAGADGLPDIDGGLMLVENVDPKSPSGFRSGQGMFRAGFQHENKLVGKSPVHIEDELMLVAHGGIRVARSGFASKSPRFKVIFVQKVVLVQSRCGPICNRVHHRQN